MDTRAAADLLGTDARTLRRFLRSASSTFQAVGSGGRYEFTEKDVPMMRKRFSEWMSTQTPKSPTKSKMSKSSSRRSSIPRSEVDRLVWNEEGEITMPDIRDPQVRRAVREEANRRAQRLDEMLLAAGLHITQWRDREHA